MAAVGCWTPHEVSPVSGGPAAGHADGIGADAGFVGISRLATGGTDLYAADGTRVRRITHAPP